MTTDTLDRVFPFLSQPMRDRILGEMKREREQTVRGARAVAWEPTKLTFQQTLVVDGTTYRPTMLWPKIKPVDAILDDWIAEVRKRAVLSPSGQLAYGLMRVPRAAEIPYHLGARKGRVLFTTAVDVPTLWQFHDGYPHCSVWASQTPMECLTQLPLLRRARGDVVVGGLGIGWFLSAVCARPRVRTVVVAEKDPEVITWLWPRIKEAYPEVARKVTMVVEADARVLAEDNAMLSYTCLLDIWKDYGDARTDRAFRALKAKFPGRVFGWGDVETERATSRW